MSETCHHDVAHHKVCERCIDERDLGATPQPQGGKRMADADFEARAHRTDQRLNWLYDEARRARAEADALRAENKRLSQKAATDRTEVNERRRLDKLRAEALEKAEAERDALRVFVERACRTYATFASGEWARPAVPCREWMPHPQDQEKWCDTCKAAANLLATLKAKP